MTKDEAVKMLERERKQREAAADIQRHNVRRMLSDGGSVFAAHETLMAVRIHCVYVEALDLAIEIMRHIEEPAVPQPSSFVPMDWEQASDTRPSDFDEYM